MKPLWTQTLVWLAAVAAAVLLALLSPDPAGASFDDDAPSLPAH
jgi:hypothetical protein